MEISNVCVLSGKYNTYGEKLMVYGHSLMKRQPLERTSNVSSKREYIWRSRVFCMQTRNNLCLIACTNPSTLLSRLM